MPLADRQKVAIVGFCETNRNMTPWFDPDFEVWGLNRGYMFMQPSDARIVPGSCADRWFDMHGHNIITSQTRRPGKHVQFLNTFPGPVYMHTRFDDVPNATVYPLAEMADFFGAMVWRAGQVVDKGNRKVLRHEGMTDTTNEPYLSSSIAYEIALAIYEGFKEIHLYGIDLNTEAEYAWQKPGVEYLLGVAAGRGIKVVLPANCPLLVGTLYGRGYLSEEPEKMSYEQLEQRRKSLQNDITRIGKEIQELTGALNECVQFTMAQLPPGLDHEIVDGHRRQIEQAISDRQAKLMQIQGAMKETAHWLHQTMAGQEPAEAMAQLRQESSGFVAEGPAGELEAINFMG